MENIVFNEEKRQPIADNFTFFETYADAVRMLPTPEEKLKYISWLIDLGIYGEEPVNDGSMAYTFFKMNALHILRKGIKKRTSGKAGGKAGGTASGQSKMRIGNLNAKK